ncbi:MAG: acyltransferase [Bacteroidales bacterium]|nr:acyltransferase [Bacteroidales bacterium]
MLFFHLFETYAETLGYQIIAHGYLAVDFFFILSGFVVGYAYDDRWDRITAWGFFKRRIVRLHPMLVMGVVVGACLYFFGQCEQFGLSIEVTWWKFLLAFVLALFMIPVGPGLDVRGWGEMNHTSRATAPSSQIPHSSTCIFAETCNISGLPNNTTRRTTVTKNQRKL